MSATKIWPINGTGSYMPESNTQILFSGVVSATGVSGVLASTVTAINVLGATNVKITEIGLFLSAASGTSLTFAGTYAGQTGLRELRYYNGKRPAWQKDGSITAILVTSSAPNDLVITDNAGNTGTFPAGSLKQGAIYPILINTVLSTTNGDFLGLSEF